MSSPRHDPQEPSSLTRIYGFVTMLTAFVLFSFYFFIAVMPSKATSHFLGDDIEGIQRIAGTIPVVLLFSMLYLVVAYAFLDLLVTPSLDDYRLITDKQARPWEDGEKQIPVIGDMPKLLWSRRIVEEANRRKVTKS